MRPHSHISRVNKALLAGGFIALGVMVVPTQAVFAADESDPPRQEDSTTTVIEDEFVIDTAATTPPEDLPSARNEGSDDDSAVSAVEPESKESAPADLLSRVGLAKKDFDLGFGRKHELHKLVNEQSGIPTLSDLSKGLK